MQQLVDRFLKYVSIDTTSNEESSTVPSTVGQLELAKALEKELKDIGMQDISCDDNGYIMATLPANTDKPIPTIGFVAHMDTSPDASGANIKPQIIKNYDGGDILLNKEKNIVMSPKIYPELKLYIGNDLITTDGTTLLGADNKAGIAEIMTAVEYLIKHPEIPHGKIRVGFTPDEEIARGTDHFDVKKFNADFAYTIDGGEIGELEYENFNAARADITINGRNAHPGKAKDNMLNAMLVAMELNSMLPPWERPEHTEGYEGFYHLNKIIGKEETTSMVYIVRDHDKEKFENRKEYFRGIVDYLNKKYGDSTVVMDLYDQYFNMKEKIQPVMHIVETAKAAMLDVGVEPKIKAIRGGTDGARLSFMGLSTPNIFTGGHNYHGRFEYTSINAMGKAVEVILKIVELYTKK